MIREYNYKPILQDILYKYQKTTNACKIVNQNKQTDSKQADIKFPEEMKEGSKLHGQ